MDKNQEDHPIRMNAAHKEAGRIGTIGAGGFQPSALANAVQEVIRVVNPLIDFLSSKVHHKNSDN